MKLRIDEFDYSRLNECSECYGLSHADILHKAIRWALKNGFSVDSLQFSNLVHQINAPTVEGIDSHDARCMLRSYLDWHYSRHGEPVKRPDPDIEREDFIKEGVKTCTEDSF